MTSRALSRAGCAGVTALTLALVACGGSSSTSTPVIPNQKPTLTFLTVPVSAITYHAAPISFLASDPDGGTPAVSVNGVAVTGSVFTFQPETAGLQTLEFKVSDGKDTVTYPLALNVLANRSPELPVSTLSIGAGSQQALSLPGVDVDNDSVSWSIKTTPSALTGKVTLTSNTLSFNAFGVAAGTYSLVLTGTESGGTLTRTLTTDRTLAVTVGALPAGFITAYPSNTTTIYAGLPFTYPFSAGSPLAGDALLTGGAWSLDGGATGIAAPAGASIDAITGKFTWTPSINITLGVPVTFGVRAKFASGVEAYQTFNLTPSRVNTAPSWAGTSGVVWPDQLNSGFFDSQSTGAVLSWPGSTPNTYRIPTSTPVMDQDIGTTDDALTFSIVKATIVGDATDTDVKGSLNLSYAAGTLTISPVQDKKSVPEALTPAPMPSGGGVYAAGVLTFVAPLTGVVKVGDTLLGQTPTLAGPNLNGDLRVTVRATDKGGLFDDMVFILPTRQNAAPVIDNVAAGGSALTSGDDYLADGAGRTLASIWPAYAVANTWKLVHAAAPAQRAYADPNGDVVSRADLLGATVNGVADTRITAAMSGTTLEVSSPVWTAADARKPYTFQVTARDMFGAVAKPVTFQGTILGTATGQQVASWRRLGIAATRTTPFDFSTYASNRLWLDPLYTSGPESYAFAWDSDLPSDLRRTYKYVQGPTPGTYSVSALPGGVYIARTSPSLAPNLVPAGTEASYPASLMGTYYYGDTDFLDLNTAGFGRLNAFRPSGEAVVPSGTGTLLTPHFQYVSLFDKGWDAFQLINPNQKSHFTSAEAGSGPRFPEAWPYARTQVWNETNNLADLDYRLDFYGGLGGNDATPLIQGSVGDVLHFGRMTHTTVGTPAVDLWRLERVATPSLNFPQWDMDNGGANPMNATFDPAFALNQSVALKVSRSAFHAHMLDSADPDALSYDGDSYRITAWQNPAFGAFETSAPTLLQVRDFGTYVADERIVEAMSVSGTSLDPDTDVDLGAVAFGKLPGTTPVIEYAYRWSVATTGFTGPVPLSAGVVTPTLAPVAPLAAPVTNLRVTAGVDEDGATVWVPASVDVSSGIAAGGADNLHQVSLAWDPQPGVSGYEVQFFEVNGGNVAPQANPTFVFRTAKSTFHFPAGLYIGRTYVFRIRTYAMPGVDFNRTPFARALPMGWAEAITGALTFPSPVPPAPSPYVSNR